MPEIKVRIEDSRSLFEALASRNLTLRLAVLRRIRSDPGRALAYGPYEGRSLVSELLRLWHQGDEGPVTRLAVLQALCQLPGVEARDSIVTLFRACENSEELLICANRLRQEDLEYCRPLLMECLEGEALHPRTRFAATLLQVQASRSGIPLAEAEQVRVALCADVACPVPAWNDATREAWLRTLRGSRWLKALCLMPDWTPLWDEQIPAEVRSYMVAHTDSNQALLNEARQNCPERATAALGRLLVLGIDLTPHRSLLDEWAELGLAIAVDAGGRVQLPLEKFRESGDLELRCALTRQLGPAELTALLDHQDAQLRAAAARHLETDTLLHRLRGPAGPGRICAAQSLLDRGQEAILARELGLPVD